MLYWVGLEHIKTEKEDPGAEKINLSNKSSKGKNNKITTLIQKALTLKENKATGEITESIDKMTWGELIQQTDKDERKHREQIHKG